MGSLARSARRAIEHANRSPLQKMMGRGKAFKIIDGKPVGKIKNGKLFNVA